MKNIVGSSPKSMSTHVFKVDIEQCMAKIRYSRFSFPIGTEYESDEIKLTAAKPAQLAFGEIGSFDFTILITVVGGCALILVCWAYLLNTIQLLIN